MTSTRVGVLVGTVLALSTAAIAQEKKIERSALPATVQKTVETEAHGATIKGFSTEREHGLRVYEAETLVDGHTRDLQVAEDGRLNEVEEEVVFESLPAGVKKGLTRKAGGARIVKVESVTKHGRLVAYEAATLLGAKKGEVQVGPEGAALRHAQ